MKKFFLLAVFVAALQIALGQKAHPLVGTWRLVSQTVTQQDSVYKRDPSVINSLCIYTATEFCFIAKNVKDNSFRHAGMGTVKFSKSSYTEFLTHCSSVGLEGRDLVFKYEVKGNRFYKHGVFPEGTLDEIWERVR